MKKTKSSSMDLGFGAVEVGFTLSPQQFNILNILRASMNATTRLEDSERLTTPTESLELKLESFKRIGKHRRLLKRVLK